MADIRDADTASRPEPHAVACAALIASTCFIFYRRGDCYEEADAAAVKTRHVGIAANVDARVTSVEQRRIRRESDPVYAALSARLRTAAARISGQIRRAITSLGFHARGDVPSLREMIVDREDFGERPCRRCGTAPPVDLRSPNRSPPALIATNLLLCPEYDT